MNTLQKIKESVTDGVKAIEEKVALMETERAGEKAQREQLKAEAEKERQQLQAAKAKEKEKQHRSRERVRNRKRRARLVRRTISSLLAGIVVLAVVAWYTLIGLGVPVPVSPVQPLWALGLVAAGALTMITGKGIPVKFGVMLLGILVLIRDNGWLWGILGSVNIWKLIAAVGIVIVIMYITIMIVRLRNGTVRSLRKARKAIAEKKESVRIKLSETKEKLRNIGGKQK